MSDKGFIEYPSKEDLRWWIGYLEKSENSFLKPYLPVVDSEWYDKIIGVIDLIKINGYPTDIHSVGAYLFYKINKAHNYVDSNKRSAIITTYLFYMINDYVINPPIEVRLLAKKIAKSRGRKRQNYWINKTKNFFETHSIKLK